MFAGRVRRRRLTGRTEATEARVLVVGAGRRCETAAVVEDACGRSRRRSRATAATSEDQDQVGHGSNHAPVEILPRVAGMTPCVDFLPVWVQDVPHAQGGGRWSRTESSPSGSARCARCGRSPTTPRTTTRSSTSWSRPRDPGRVRGPFRLRPARRARPRRGRRRRPGLRQPQARLPRAVARGGRGGRARRTTAAPSSSPTAPAVFVLGEAGLLDGRRCTTHWRHVDELARAVPRGAGRPRRALRPGRHRSSPAPARPPASTPRCT